MEKITEFLDKLFHTQIVSSIIIVIVSLALYRGLIYIMNKSEERDKLKLLENKKNRTYLKLVKSLIRYIFIIITVLILLQVNGVNVSSLLAGVGILGAIVGLAIQDWLKDIIRGSSILSDSYFSVGDIVKYNDIEGKVLVIGLKTTKIQDIKTGNIISIANRNIEQIEVVSNFSYINIPLPYELPVENAEKVINKIVQKANEVEIINSCKYLGINELADSSIKYLIEIDSNLYSKLKARRELIRITLLELEKEGISVPYNQIDVHTK